MGETIGVHNNILEAFKEPQESFYFIRKVRTACSMTSSFLGEPLFTTSKYIRAYSTRTIKK